MAYYDKFEKEYWEELGKSIELFKPYPLTQDEIDRSILIADEIIDNYSKRIIEDREPIPFGTALIKSATVYQQLGMYKIAKQAINILSHINYQDNNSNKEEDLTVQSLMIKTGATVSKRPYYLEIPKTINSTTIHFIVHEIAHMLKESNYKECKGIYSDIEIIPILIELISAYISDDNNVFKKRESLMFEIAYNFRRLQEDIENNLIEDKDQIGFNTLYRQNILYLNSFYYSLRLFTMYLEAPLYVLVIIEDVLNQKLTSREVINYYLSNDDYTYETGINQFRKRLK